MLITVDTLRADRLGCYGAKDVATPAADALAREGVLFERAVAQVPLTWPSHVVMLTGTYPFHNGVQDFTGQPLAAEFRTLAQSLKDRGYATGAVVSSFVLDRTWGLARGFDRYDDAQPGSAFFQQDLGLVSRRAAESVDRALAWLQTAAREQRPFFLWLHLFDPHSPYDPPEAFRTRYAGRLYDGEVAYTDEQLARLVAWLWQNQLYDNTLVVLVSDHGESLGEHGEDEHGFFVYQSTLHVPLIVKLPAGMRAAQRRIADAVETTSLAPTILELVGVEDAIQSQFQAPSLAQWILRGHRPALRPAYAETFYPFRSFGWSPLRSMQTEQYQFIEAPKAELYDLGADPQQRVNLAAKDEKTVGALRQQLEGLAQRYAAKRSAAPGEPADAQAAEKLRSLGYVAYRAPAPKPGEKLSDPKDKLREFNAILKATDAFSAGDLARGRVMLRVLQKTEPNLYLIPFLLGEGASREGKWVEAAAEFEKCLKLNPQFDQAMTGLARALGMQGKSAEAKRWIEIALALNRQNYRALFERARIEARENPLAAAATLEKIIAVQPNFAPAHRDLGLLKINRQEYAAAVRRLEKAVELGLADAMTLNFLGIGYSRTGQLERAVASYQRVLEMEPKLAQAHLNLGFAYERLNRPADAEREYEAACRLEKKLCELIEMRKRQRREKGK